MFLKELMGSIALAALLEPKEKIEITVVDDEASRQAKRQRDKELDEIFSIPRINESYAEQEPVVKYFINVQEEENRRIITISRTKMKDSVLGIPHSDMAEAIKEVKRLKDHYIRSNFVVETHMDLLE